MMLELLVSLGVGVGCLAAALGLTWLIMRLLYWICETGTPGGREATIPCQQCYGTGELHYGVIGWRTCGTCHGDGVLPDPWADFPRLMYDRKRGR